MKTLQKHCIDLHVYSIRYRPTSTTYFVYMQSYKWYKQQVTANVTWDVWKPPSYCQMKGPLLEATGKCALRTGLQAFTPSPGYPAIICHILPSIHHLFFLPVKIKQKTNYIYRLSMTKTFNLFKTSISWIGQLIGQQKNIWH